MLLALWSAYEWVTGSEDLISRGGFSDYDARKYRKHIERLEELTRTRQITKKDINSAEKILSIPVELNEIKRVSESKKDIDFSALAFEIAKIQDYLSRVLFQYERQKELQEQDDELAILLII